MKKKIILSSLLALGVLGGVVGLAQRPIGAEAGNHGANAKLYFVKPSGWSNVSMFIGHSTYSIDYKMTKIENTNDLYYLNVPSWDGWSGWCFADINNWGVEYSDISNRINYCTNTKLDTSYALNSNEYYLFVPQNGNDNASVDSYWRGKDNKHLHMNNGVSVNSNDTAGGQLTISGYTFSSDNAVSTTSSSTTASLATATINAGCYTSVTMTASVNEGYEFDGWYSSEDSITALSKETSYKVDIGLEGATYYAKFTRTVPEVPTVTELLTSYYNEGTYTRNTTINLNTDALDDISTHFHGSVVLERTTLFQGEELWMTRGETETTYSYYGTSGENMTTGTATEWGVAPEKVGTVTKDHKDWDPNGKDENGMEGFYITLKDIMEKASTVEWTYSNGVYSTAGLTEEFLAFTAPCLLDTQNYVQYTGVEVAEVGETLVLRLLASETNSGALSVETNVLSQAVITK